MTLPKYKAMSEKKEKPEDIAAEWAVSEDGTRATPILTLGAKVYPAIGLETGETYKGSELEFVWQYKKLLFTGWENLDRIPDDLDNAFLDTRLAISLKAPANQQRESVEENTAEQELIADITSIMLNYGVDYIHKPLAEYVKKQTALLQKRIEELESKYKRVINYSTDLEAQLEAHKQPQVSGDYEHAAQKLYPLSCIPYKNNTSFNTLQVERRTAYIQGRKDEAANKPNWISLKDKLPERNYTNVLVYTSNKYIVDAEFKHGIFYEGLNELKNITHWMPLPTPPTKEAAE